MQTSAERVRCNSRNTVSQEKKGLESVCRTEKRPGIPGVITNLQCGVRAVILLLWSGVPEQALIVLMEAKEVAD